MVSYLEPSPVTLELAAGEKLLWSGRPKQGIVFRASDAFLIPFSLLWAGFAVFWEFSVVTSGGPVFFTLWGLPFLVVGAYFTIGRFFVDAYIRANTYYGLTNERAILISGLLNRQVKSINARTMSDVTLIQQSDGSGTITFGSMPPYMNWHQGMAWPGMSQTMPPQFEMIGDARQVYQSIRHVQMEK